MQLSGQRLVQLWNQIQTDIELSYERVYAFDNYNVKLKEAGQENGNYIINVDVSVDMTLIRNPEQCPFILGMKNAANLIEDSLKKEQANDIINHYLQEFMQYYNVPIQRGFLYQIQIPAEDNYSMRNISEMQIFHRIDLDNAEVFLNPVEENPSFTEAFQQSDGTEILNEALSIPENRQTRTVSYSRASAVTYAINHATDEPEFTADNYGSDCANFVSKCLNAGGIPVDREGEWYPGNSWGTLGGKHWYRTGHNRDMGGVIIYMAEDHNYFSVCSKSQVNTGCIMSWNNTSHVALVTLCDGSTIQYSQHSSTKKDNVYYVYKNESVTFYKSNI